MAVATPVVEIPPLPRPDRFGPLVIDVARCEWTKLYTVRSTYCTLLCTVAGMIVFGGLLDASYAHHYTGTGRPPRSVFDPAAYSMSGFFLAQLAIAVLGVVVITSEYQTGSIRATLSALPQRRLMLAVNAAVFGAVATLTGLAAAVGSFLVGQVILAPKHLNATIDDPGTLRSIVGATLYLALIGLVALGIGALIRRTAGAIAAVVGVIIVLPVFIEGLPQAWQNAITRFLPSAAGQAVIGRTRFTPPDATLLPPWVGLAVLCAYAAAVFTAAAIALERRDA
jgi:ABC-2 type transport system permease protein